MVRAGVATFGLLPLLVALTPAAVAANQPPVRRIQVVSTVHRNPAASRPLRSAVAQTAVDHGSNGVFAHRTGGKRNRARLARGSR
jgi:hypothetical protein